MADRISTYRQIRLVVHPGRVRPDQSYWALHAVRVVKGVPHAVVLRDGFVPMLEFNCSEADIMEAIELIASTFGAE